MMCQLTNYQIEASRNFFSASLFFDYLPPSPDANLLLTRVTSLVPDWNIPDRHFLNFTSLFRHILDGFSALSRDKEAKMDRRGTRQLLSYSESIN